MGAAGDGVATEKVLDQHHPPIAGESGTDFACGDVTPAQAKVGGPDDGNAESRIHISAGLGV